MQTDKHLYNIESQQQMTVREKYISQISQQSLNQVQTQLTNRVNDFNPDDEQTIKQIRNAFRLYIQLMSNQTFTAMPINDQSFICSLAFYLSAEKQTSGLSRGIVFIQHQYSVLQQKAYAESINLFKALLQIYQSVDEQYYERITLLILKMVVQNVQLLTVINHKYYFLQCLIQVVNQCNSLNYAENKPQQLCQYFAKLRKLYSCKKAFLFHSIDFQILVDILLRTLINENQSEIIEQTLKLYLILSENPIISKDRYRVQEFHEAIKEKINLINQETTLDQNLKNIIHELLNFH